MKEAKRRRKVLEFPEKRLLNGTVVAVRLYLGEQHRVLQRLLPEFAEPWIVAACFEGGMTYKVCYTVWGH